MNTPCSHALRKSLCVCGAFAALLALSACASSSAQPPTNAQTSATLTVYAAASLQDAFSELSRNFEGANPGVKIAFSYAGSQQLAQQITQGAPADIFASANQAQMDVAVRSGRIISATAKPFVRNRLVVVLPKANPAGIMTLHDLAKPKIKLVLAAKEVPAGQYALQFLGKATADSAFPPGYKAAVLKNVVSYEDNVRSVLSKVALGEADAGIVYTTDINKGIAGQVSRIEIPDALNTIASYPIAALKDSPHAALASSFIAYLLSDAGQKIMASYGFISVNAQ